MVGLFHVAMFQGIALGDRHDGFFFKQVKSTNYCEVPMVSGFWIRCPRIQIERRHSRLHDELFGVGGRSGSKVTRYHFKGTVKV